MVQFRPGPKRVAALWHATIPFTQVLIVWLWNHTHIDWLIAVLVRSSGWYSPPTIREAILPGVTYNRPILETPSRTPPILWRSSRCVNFLPS